MRPIVVQKQDETQTVVKSGADAAGERVVTTGFARLTDGSKVTIGSDTPVPPAAAAPGCQRQAHRRKRPSGGRPTPRQQ